VGVVGAIPSEWFEGFYFGDCAEWVEFFAPGRWTKDSASGP